MDFGILGPLEVGDEGRILSLGGTRQRALLALLLLNANQVVSSARLIDELWGDDPPDSGTAALQVRVSQLRKALGAGGGAIVTRAPGYVIHLGSDQLDLQRFERLLAEADRDLRGGDPGQASSKLGEALSLWRGAPLADLADEAFAQPAIARLEELRLVAQELRIEADLTLGRHNELVGELEALVAAHPLREGLCRQLMLALYRSGRQAEALEAYQTSRRTLVEELGIEPGPRLKDLERSVLRQDRSLDLVAAPALLRSILVAGIGDQPLEALLSLAELLASRPQREVIVARVFESREALARAAADLAARCDALRARGVVARPAVFTSGTPGKDVARLAAEQDVDLVLVAGSGLLDDPELAELLRTAPCDVSVFVGQEATSGPVLVPFGGNEHDWSAIELGAWLAGAWQVPLRLAGPAVDGGRDASRLLASASLAVQRALGIAAEPLLVEPGSGQLVAVASGSAISVVGLSERWRAEGLGSARAELVASGRPVLLVRKGLRPGGLAPPQNLTRFSWSLAAG
ncbi:MAG TPA: AfsR/SARP family transcriptional regulator [Gaiellaceae bacterium]|nr:AfsR/SARP family transcriptional regulator [Gaiellaceae bacterium]